MENIRIDKKEMHNYSFTSISYSVTVRDIKILSKTFDSRDRKNDKRNTRRVIAFFLKHFKSQIFSREVQRRDSEFPARTLHMEY